MAAHGTHDSAHHIIPRPTYFKVFAALIFLTIVTVAASRVDFGAMNTIVAFTIATIKATLVASIFMHLKYDDRMNRLILFAALFFLLVFYFFCILDEITRIAQHAVI